MQLKFYTLDVFTAQRFGGNPLAVVLGSERLTTPQMQAIAREFNLSETIFIMSPKDPANTAGVRIFFPTGEIPFAGHPTVGAAIVLAENLMGDGQEFALDIQLEEVAGLVPVKVRNTGGASWAQFTAPVVPTPVAVPLPSLDALASALRLDPADIGLQDHGLGVHEGGPRFLYVPIASREALAKARSRGPEWSALLEGLGAGGAYLYTEGGERPDTSYRTRMLIPAGEGAEDPATGSAAALFASQLHRMLGLSDGTHAFKLEQGYEMGRPSNLDMEADIGGGELIAVRVAGTAVGVTEGLLSL